MASVDIPTRVRGRQARERRAVIEAAFPHMDADEVVRKYDQHRRNAGKRSVPWEFTLESWCRKWIESGKWAERGSGKYAMARNGDVGPYSPTNVDIIPNAQNIKDAWRNRPQFARKPRACKKQGGL